MPGPDARGGPRSLIAALRFQVLRVSFEISVDDAALERTLRFLVQSAVQPEPARSRVAYAVRRYDGAYEISREGAVVDVQFDPPGVLQVLYQWVQLDALAVWPEAAVLRAVTGRQRGERFLVVGERQWDRSRLALHLLSHGVDIEGDQLTILNDGVITAYPRPLRVCGVDVPLPPGVPALATLPFTGSDPVTGPWALDLAPAGVDWQITTGPPSTIVVLETNYGGQTRVSTLPSYDTVRALMSACDPLGNPVRAIRAVAALVDDTRRCYHLWLGSLEHIDDSWVDRFLC